MQEFLESNLSKRLKVEYENGQSRTHYTDNLDSFYIHQLTMFFNLLSLYDP